MILHSEPHWIQVTENGQEYLKASSGLLQWQFLVENLVSAGTASGDKNYKLGCFLMVLFCAT